MSLEVGLQKARRLHAESANSSGAIARRAVSTLLRAFSVNSGSRHPPVVSCFIWDCGIPPNSESAENAPTAALSGSIYAAQVLPRETCFGNAPFALPSKAVL